MTTTLGKVCDIYNGNSINANYKKTHFEGLAEGFPFIATKDVSFNGLVDYDNGVKIPFDTKYKKAHRGSVLICAEGGSAGRKIARIDQTVCFGNKLFCLVPKDNSLIQDFLYYYLLSESFQDQFKESIAGLIGGVSSSKIKAFNITFPSIDEQRRIVERLKSTFDKIDEMQKNAEQAYEEAKAIYLKQLELAMTPRKGWKEAKLKALCSKIGSGATPRGGKKIYISEGCSLIRSLNVHKTFFKYDELAHITDQAAQALKGVTIHENDVLFNITGASIARCCVVPSDILPARVNQHVSILRTDGSEILPDFLCYVLNSPQHQKSLLAIGENGATRQAITKADLEGHLVRYPDIKEQKLIVEKLKTLSDRLKKMENNYAKLIVELTIFKQAILKETFE